MESIKIQNLNFTYPKRNNKALDDINITINQGEFVTICGKSGCGKTTLIKMFKPAISPIGKLDGEIFFEGKKLIEYSKKDEATKIGFVMQNVESQIVTDKVWHELSFGLESLGYKTNEIRAKVSEMASFFGIQNWFYKNVTELSGGQKQILNLASIMVLNPSLLVLDEPTSMLDPIAAQEFINILEKINKELGVTIILVEHHLEESFPISDRVVVMDEGKIIANDKPKVVAQILKNMNHDMYDALPTQMRVYGEIENKNDYPLTVGEGRVWLNDYASKNKINTETLQNTEKEEQESETIIEIKDAWFRYEKDLPDVIKGVNLSVKKGEIFSIVGGNGTGKTTLLSLISGLNKTYRGNVFIKGEKISKIKNLYTEILGVLPQNPQCLFSKKTVYLDLMEILEDRKISKKEELVKEMTRLCKLENLLKYHPYDLSGGEQQRVALAKVLLKNPEILILDEPTKGMDAHFKKEFANILNELKNKDVTIIIVSHDIEFCAEYSTRCAMFFDGNITSIDKPREFFCGKNFYTTVANRMARNIIPNAILAEDIIKTCNGKFKENNTKGEEENHQSVFDKFENEDSEEQNNNKKFETRNNYKKEDINNKIEVTNKCTYKNEKNIKKEQRVNKESELKNKKKSLKRVLITITFLLLIIPITIYIGVEFLENKKYYFISLLIILEAMIPFLANFEKRKPKVRELIVISVLCAIAVASRIALFMFPQFKPIIAIIIIVGACFGGETAFLVGALTGFISNFFFGQGPWTVWQMFTLRNDRINIWNNF